MINWTPPPRLARILRNVCAAGWLLCVIVAVTIVVAPGNTILGFTVALLFMGIFPVHFGAVIIITRRTLASIRTSGPRDWNWMSTAFRGLPKAFRIFFETYFFGILLVGAYLMLREGLRRPEWPNLGVSAGICWMLLPSVFYLLAAGVYWSAALESEARP